MAKKLDALGDRMKSNYEARYKIALTRRTPVIIRLDGKAFHTFTKYFDRPYDKVLHDAMNYTTKKLCENIQGCKFGYTQSDEISLLLTDFDRPTTDAWFDYELQKMCSISASIATYYFNTALIRYLNESDQIDSKKVSAITRAIEKGALFDSRCFNIPESEIANYFIWRQNDATRNAVQMLGQTYFSPKQLHKKNTDQIQEMLWSEKQINFNDMSIEFKRGVGCYKAVESKLAIDNKSGKPIICDRRCWKLDFYIPIFSKDKAYIIDKINNSEE